MKRRITFSLLLIGCTFQVIAQNELPASCPGGFVVTADGNGDDWPMDWQLDPEKAMDFNACVDDNNLYLRLRVRDESVKRKVAAFGLTVWMDPNGKKKKKLGLKFPTGEEGKEKLQAMRDSFNENMSASEKDERRKELNKELIENVEVMELIGLTDDPLTSSRSGITNGIKVAIASSPEGDYIYEAVIPFKSFRLSKSTISNLGVGFETGKFVAKQPKQNVSAPPMGGGGGGYGGGYGGGRGRGGYGGGYGGGGYGSQSNWQGQQGPRNQDFMSSTAVWTSLKIK